MKCCKTDKPIVFNEVRNQFLTVVCANLMAVAHGGLMGWFSPANLYFKSYQNETFDNGAASPVGTTDDDALSWLASISYVGAFIGTIFFMEIIKVLGRKNTFLILAIPNFVFWLAIALSKQIGYLYAARFMGGFVGGGAYLSIPLLVTEISEDHVRGILGSMLMIFINIGIMMAYLSGTYMTYYTSPFVMMVFPAGVFLSFLFIPDTPMSLLERKKSDASIEKSIKFYLNIKDAEMTEYNKTRFENALELVHARGEKQRNKPKFTCGEMWKNLTTKDALVGFGKAMAIVFFSICCGSPVLQNYSSKVFTDSGTSLDPQLCSIIMIVIQVAATIIATSLVDNVGRRLLLIVSCFGTALGLTVMGTFDFLKKVIKIELEGWDWVPVASISFTVFLAYIGLLPLVFVIIMEVLPAKVRETYATICLSFVSLFMFVIVKAYPFAEKYLGMYSCMWFFAFVAFLGMLFGILVLEETKGKKVNE